MSCVNTGVAWSIRTNGRLYTPTIMDIADAIEPCSPFSYLCYNAYNYTDSKIQRVIDKSSVIIRIDGACSDNGHGHNVAGVGCYFGPNSPYNVCQRFHAADRHTNQRAEIQSALAALAVMKRHFAGNRSIKRVVLATDSAYVVNSMSDWVLTWKMNDWQAPNCKSVLNRDRLEKLNDLIEELECYGLVIQFWQVPRENNGEAVSLANIARM